METIQSAEKHQIQKDRISIDDYLAELKRRRIEIINNRDQFKWKLPLDYNQFCDLICAHGSCYFASRGEITATTSTLSINSSFISIVAMNLREI